MNICNGCGDDLPPGINYCVSFEEVLEDGFIFERVKCNNCGLTQTNVAPPKEL